MTDTSGYMAVVVSPEGRVWESTASVATGHEAEHRARRQAEFAFVSEVLGYVIKDGLEHVRFFVWDAARNNGFQCVVTPVTIEHKAGS